MKAISIRQPWLELIIRGEKTLEIRSWRTNIRGDVLLCASAAPKILDLPNCQLSPLYAARFQKILL